MEDEERLGKAGDACSLEPPASATSVSCCVQAHSALWRLVQWAHSPFCVTQKDEQRSALGRDGVLPTFWAPKASEVREAYLPWAIVPAGGWCS